jgi:Uma2 family endonuclease
MAPLPTTGHSRVTFNISGIFYNYLKGKKCTAFSDNTYVRLDKIKCAALPDENKKDRLIPDVSIVCNTDIIKKDGLYGAPDLVAEVLSRATRGNNRGIKKDIYEAIGIKEYWIVDADNMSIEVYLLKSGKYQLDKVYAKYTEEEYKTWLEDKENGEEVEEIIKKFKTSIFDDLTVSLDDVFEKTQIY